ncbi:polyprenyl synthetase family protein [Kocuria marina]|uniref:polyprenyl synthetase family protein n=1 Tax=Kocuria marina TaxID=223184 RepID=UPI0011A9B1CE|nr:MULTISPECIES: polyprenyl synthetase family protein [Kocuria]MCT2020305.1 polyprenyl synthetase family protein [Kocuria marina]
MTPTSSYTSSGTGRRSQEFTPAAALRGFLEHSSRRAAELSPGYEHVWECVARVTGPGDGLQQGLVMAAAESYPARPTRPVLNAVAAAFELLRASLELRGGVQTAPGGAPPNDLSPHDATMARSAPTDAAGEADDALASDLALSGAYRMIATSHAPESRLLKLLDILDHASFHAAAGDRMAAEHARRAGAVSRQEVLDALRIGSAVPCFEAPLRAGAVLGGAPTAQVTALAQAGRALGVAHALAGELSACTGAEDAAAPVRFLTSGRRTVLGCLVESGPHGPAWRALRERCVQGTASPDDVARAGDLLSRSGADGAVARMVEIAVERARDALTAGDLPEPLTERLTGWAERELIR